MINIFMTIFLLFSQSSWSAQNKLFEMDSILDIVIKSDFPYERYYGQPKQSEYEKYPAEVTVNDSNHLSYSVQAKLQARGSGRLSHCEFAPFKIRVSKKSLINPFFRTDTNYKVVTHCYKSYENLSELDIDKTIIKEYLMYKILEKMNVATFKVRLLNVTYLNSDNNLIAKRPAFIIESDEELIERLNLIKEIESENLNQFFNENDPESQIIAKLQSMIDPSSYVNSRLGQLAILNYDWSPGQFLTSGGNMKVFLTRNNKLLQIHYDFDLSYLVGFSKTSVKNQRFNYNFPISVNSDQEWISDLMKESLAGLNLENNKSQISKTTEELRVNRKTVLDYIDQFSLLNNVEKNEVKNRMEIFFEALGS